ncbi:hypothetical protein RSK20926_11809 [Roseobacter sp. SK209-2-6]|uniref:hypothetical protein n=1 Tax=Roseobacter sp. SK209-2-6 TaxID=388739 RepID=UPI0000F3C460|nr:hypothetical protein [Roseobacter sp. SK209-2-6]EBA18403.1 hypothetical protein RSK20926_11809 [Roseobacter sp. SK209-2-6]
MEADGLEIPVVANQGQFNRAMKEVLRTSNLTADQVKKKFAEANPKEARMFERFAENQARAYDRIAQKLDPVVRNSRQLERVQEQLSLAVQSGAITQDQANRQLSIAKMRYSEVSAAAATAGETQKSFLNVSRQGRFIIGNTTNQLADMAVQWEMGTNPMRIMGQQLPQVLGGFTMLAGPVGILAGLLGTVAAIGFPMAAFLMTTGEEAEKAGKKVETFADALQEAESAIGRAQAAMQLASAGGVEDLGEIYGAVTQKVISLSEALADIEVRAAKVEIGQLLDKTLGEEYQAEIDKIFSAVGSALIESGTDRAKENADLIRQQIQDLEAQIATSELGGGLVTAALQEQRQEMLEELAAIEGRYEDIGSLAKDLTIPPEVLSSYRELEARLQAARDAGDFAVMASVLSEMRQTLAAMGDTIDQGVRDQLAQAEDQARRMAQALSEGRNIASELGGLDLSGGINSAVTAAAALAEQLGISLDLARRLSGAGVGRNVVLDPRDPRYNERDARLAGIAAHMSDFSSNYGTVSPFDPSRLPKPPKRKKGGGGKSSSSEDFDLGARAAEEVQALQRKIELLGKSRAEIAALTFKYQRLDEAKARGIDLDQVSAKTGKTVAETIDQQAQKVGELAAKYEAAAEQARFFDGVNSDLKNGILDAAIEGENLGDVLDSIAKKFARAALEAALFGEGPLKGKYGLSSGGLFGGGAGSGGGGLFGGAIIPGILHSGGIAGKDGYSHGRSFAPSTWAGAPRYHQGGIAGLRPGEVPAILEVGEPVLPKDYKMRALGSRAVGAGERANLSVVIHNAPEGQHQVQQSQDGRTLEIHLERVALNAVAGPKGKQMMKSTYGIKPPARGR